MREKKPPAPLGRVRSRALRGIEAPEVVVETSLAGGLPGFNVVGLPEAAVRESRERVKSAIAASHLTFPRVRVVVNLAPADLPKEGGRFDLPIALSVLARTKQIRAGALDGFEAIGELGLYGEVRGARGALSAALAATAAGRALIVPAANAAEAALAPGSRVFPVAHLGEVVGLLHDAARAPWVSVRGTHHRPATLLDRIRGQRAAKRALEIAAAGGHHFLMRGPPGAGKTLLARCLPALLPPLGDEESIEVVRIHSAAGLCEGDALPVERPFREPHHTASAAAVIGGGGQLPRPGEISLAHNGVLFLDEFPEFDRRTLEGLRQPLEGGTVAIARASGRIVYPARFQLVAAMNPCPAGRLCTAMDCTCRPGARSLYATRLSAPILDRIDLRIDLPAVTAEELLAPAGQDSSNAGASLGRAIADARTRQLERAGRLNVALDLREVERDCRLDSAATRLVHAAMEQRELTARGCHRVMRVARTIADLAGREDIAVTDVAEALSYRGRFVEADRR